MSTDTAQRLDETIPIGDPLEITKRLGTATPIRSTSEIVDARINEIKSELASVKPGETYEEKKDARLKMIAIDEKISDLLAQNSKISPQLIRELETISDEAGFNNSTRRNEFATKKNQIVKKYITDDTLIAVSDIKDLSIVVDEIKHLSRYPSEENIDIIEHGIDFERKVAEKVLNSVKDLPSNPSISDIIKLQDGWSNLSGFIKYEYNNENNVDLRLSRLEILTTIALTSDNFIINDSKGNFHINEIFSNTPVLAFDKKGNLIRVHEGGADKYRETIPIMNHINIFEFITDVNGHSKIINLLKQLKGGLNEELSDVKLSKDHFKKLDAESSIKIAKIESLITTLNQMQGQEVPIVRHTSNGYNLSEGMTTDIFKEMFEIIGLDHMHIRGGNIGSYLDLISYWQSKSVEIDETSGEAISKKNLEQQLIDYRDKANELQLLVITGHNEYEQFLVEKNKKDLENAKGQVWQTLLSKVLNIKQVFSGKYLRSSAQSSNIYSYINEVFNTHIPNVEISRQLWNERFFRKTLDEYGKTGLIGNLIKQSSRVLNSLGLGDLMLQLKSRSSSPGIDFIDQSDEMIEKLKTELTMLGPKGRPLRPNGRLLNMLLKFRLEPSIDELDRINPFRATWNKLGGMVTAFIANSLDRTMDSEKEQNWIDEVLGTMPRKANFMRNMALNSLTDKNKDWEVMYDKSKAHFLGLSVIMSRIELFQDAFNNKHSLISLSTVGTADEQLLNSFKKGRVPSVNGGKDEVIDFWDLYKETGVVPITFKMANSTHMIEIPLNEMTGSIEELQSKISKTLIKIIDLEKPSEGLDFEADIYNAITIGHDEDGLMNLLSLSEEGSQNLNTQIQKIRSSLCNIDLSHFLFFKNDSSNTEKSQLTDNISELELRGRNGHWNINGNNYLVSLAADGSPIIISAYDHVVIDGVQATNIVNLQGKVARKYLKGYLDRSIEANEGEEYTVQRLNLDEIFQKDFKGENSNALRRRMSEIRAEERFERLIIQNERLDDIEDILYSKKNGLKTIYENSELPFIGGITPNTLSMYLFYLQQEIDENSGTNVMIDRSELGIRVVPFMIDDQMQTFIKRTLNDIYKVWNLTENKDNFFQNFDNELLSRLIYLGVGSLGENIKIANRSPGSPSSLQLKEVYRRLGELSSELKIALLGDANTDQNKFGSSSNLWGRILNTTYHSTGLDKLKEIKSEEVNTALVNMSRLILSKLGNFAVKTSGPNVVAPNRQAMYELGTSAYGSGPNSAVSIAFATKSEGRSASKNDYSMDANIHFDKIALQRQFSHLGKRGAEEKANDYIANYENNLKQRKHFMLELMKHVGQNSNLNSQSA